jgi:hypothetical protein
MRDAGTRRCTQPLRIVILRLIVGVMDQVGDEPQGAESQAVDPLGAMLDRPFTEMTVDELMALKAEFEARGIHIYNGASPEQVILAFLAGNFCSAFLQALGQRAGNSVANLPKQASDLVRKHVKRGGREEYHISAGDEATATVVITTGMPDDAWLALPEVDVTAPEVRGKRLVWDNDGMVWRTDNTED